MVIIHAAYMEVGALQPYTHMVDGRNQVHSEEFTELSHCSYYLCNAMSMVTIEACCFLLSFSPTSQSLPFL